MGIFPDTQWKLTPQSFIRSGRISNSSEMLWMFSLPASMKKVRSKIKALECSTLYSNFRCAKADNSGVGGGIWPKFELIQAVLVTCKNEDDRIKKAELEYSQYFYHYKPMGIFPDVQGQVTPQSLVRSGRISNSSEML